MWCNDISIEGVNIKKSVIYHVFKQPKLFEGIKFYFMGHHDHEVYKIGRTTVQELVLMGKGKILKRAQSEVTAAEDIAYPYHVKSEKLAQCCNYIIFPEEQPAIVYNMRELQTRSVKWLLNCIINYCIRDNFE